MDNEKVLVAKARFGFQGRIVVDNCPYCHRQHVHTTPVGEGQRMAPCRNGEYTLDFNEDGEPDAEVRMT